MNAFIRVGIAVLGLVLAVATASAKDAPASSASTHGPAAPVAIGRTLARPSVTADSADGEGGFWDAPYYHHGYADFGPFDSVDEAIDHWWADWQRVWPGWDCGYTTEYTDPDTNNGYVAGMQLESPCGGGNAISATQYAFDPAGNNGEGAGCDGGEGSDGGGGDTGSSSGSASSCESNKGLPDTGTPTAGDPINTATGNKYVQEDDYAEGPWLRFRRFYNSHPSASSSAMGTRWSHSFDRSLVRTNLNNGSSVVVAARPSGLREVFRKSGGSAWTTTANNPDILTESLDAQGATIGYSLWVAALRHTETYGTDGTLRSVQDATGQAATLTYSDSLTDPSIAPKPGLLLTVVAPDGRMLTFSYDAGAHLHKLTVPDGGTFVYGYDTTANLTSVQYPDGKSRQYVYNESNLTAGNNLPSAMTGIVDENGVRFEDTAFDGAGRATSTQFAGGAGRVAVRYNDDGSSDVTYPLGGTSHQGYATVQGLLRVATIDKPCGECGQPYASRTYDANSRPASYTDFNGNVRAMTYDANGLPTQEIDAQGSSDQRTIDTTWNTSLRVPLLRTVKDASGSIVQKEGWAYNSRGQTAAQCLIDPVKAPSYTCAATGTVPTGVRRTTLTYCESVSTTCPLVGLLLKVDGPRTDVTDTLTYAWYQQLDESGCAILGGACHRPGDLKTVTDGAGLVTTYVSYDKAGRPARVKAPNGVFTDYTYTPRGWLATATVRALAAGTASSLDAISTVTYNPDGTIHKFTDPDGVATTYIYDGAHRLTDISDAQGARYHYTLDVAGNRTKEDVFDAAGAVVRTTSQTFNPLGQLSVITDGLNRTVFSAVYADSYDSNGNLLHSQDGLGIQRKQVYDGLNRLVSTLHNYKGDDVTTANTQTDASFDALDRVTGLSDPDGLITTYELDALNNQISTQSPDTGLTRRVFDIAGNLIANTDAIGDSRSMTYDADNRLSGVSFADSSLDIQYKYDESDAATNCLGNFGGGHLTRVIEMNGGITWCYDAFGRVTKKIQMSDMGPRTTLYSWTAAGRIASLTTPNGTTLTYTRDITGKAQSIKAFLTDGTTATLVSNVVYQPFGPIASLRLGSSQTVTYTYDLSGANTDVVGGPYIKHLRRDVTGNVTALVSAVSIPTETYSYDPLHRLTGVQDDTGNPLASYTYNRTGDRLTKTAPGLLTGNYHYTEGTHHLTAVGTTTRVVDARGNTTANVMASGTYGYGYNQRNRLTVVQRDGLTVGTYLVNALGQRTQKVAGGVKTFFDYSEDGQLTGEAGGTTSRDYIWLGNMPVALIDRSGTSATISYIIADGLGTPRNVVQATGRLKWNWTDNSNPFGENGPLSSSGYVLNLRYAGQYFDSESGLSYNLNRDYEPAAGRYIQSDPIGLDGGLDTYAYAAGNPLVHADPSGLQVVETMLRFPPSTFLSEEPILPRPLISPKPGFPERPLPDDFPPLPKEGSQCPGEGWEWRGRDAPGGPRGAWYNADKDWSLHPDLDHPEPIPPHWDWVDENEAHYRLTPQAPSVPGQIY